MSAAKTGTPAAESCSASSCRVFVLPVPVAPATSPCRLSIASGILTGTPVSVRRVHHQATELEGRTLEGVPGRDRGADRVLRRLRAVCHAGHPRRGDQGRSL